MCQYRKILVTGASGQLGRKLVRRLLAEGFAVRAQYRSEEQADRWNPEKVEIVYGDMLEDGWYNDAVAGCDAVIHCAAWVTMRKVDLELMRRVNVAGTRRIAEACHDSDTVKRLLHISSVAAIGGSSTGSPLDEEAENNLLKYNVPYFTTKYEAERTAFSYNDKSLEVIAVNPSIMISPPNRKVTDADLAKLPKRLPFYINFGLNLVNTEDVIEGIISALDKGRAGERYILGGEDIDQETAFFLAGKFLGIPKPYNRLPYHAIVAAGYILDGITSIKRIFRKNTPAPKLSGNFARLAKYNFFFDSLKAKTELDYSPRPLIETIEDILPPAVPKPLTGCTADRI